MTWGTKGLTDNSVALERAEKRRMLRLGPDRRLDRRGQFALVGLGLDYSGVWIKSVSSVVEVFTLIFLVVLSVAATTWVYAGGRSLFAVGRSLVTSSQAIAHASSPRREPARSLKRPERHEAARGWFWRILSDLGRSVRLE